jgi:hypothetical protein
MKDYELQNETKKNTSFSGALQNLELPQAVSFDQNQ